MAPRALGGPSLSPEWQQVYGGPGAKQSVPVPSDRLLAARGSVRGLDPRPVPGRAAPPGGGLTGLRGGAGSPCQSSSCARDRCSQVAGEQDPPHVPTPGRRGAQRPLAGRIDCGEPRGRDLGQPRAGGQSPHPTVPAPTPEAGGLTLPRGLAGENVTAFFSRVAALAFEQSVLQALERRSGCPLQVGDGDLIRAYRPRVEGSGGGPGAGCGLKSTSPLPPPRVVLSPVTLTRAHRLPDPPASPDPSLLPCPPGSLPTSRLGTRLHGMEGSPSETQGSERPSGLGCC
ncbi:hypothetical protein QTO34_011844 [Cnephaeus nilssonii]|uniref:Uncharacterized protein n=1 Tax=Cnephaeus nilssonii TaxID=3371016 RepID=A0AA40HBQ5_CNENI|nr:hypothetical protein QTO34_011844 [Eptesicus nilssonii]